MMSRIIDHGAVVAGWVGIGMAVTVGISFLLVIPIEPIYWLLTPFTGVLIGYYANQRSDRRNGPWGRILANALYAGAVTAVTLAALLLAVKALFFFADTGYRDASLGGPISCSTGADCVYQRYLDDGRGPDLAKAGVTNPASFTGFYWNQQFTTAGTLIGLCVGGGLFGGLLYGASRPRGTRSATNPAPG
ncbi:MAG TPA: hypothetical protein VNF73_13180 [Candidatus Saccharimonadales bacterium]|nr:hypothetical protein [Candidatus Saccharimonadales bacterium]